MSTHDRPLRRSTARRLAATATALALAAGGLAACGSDDDEGSASAAGAAAGNGAEEVSMGMVLTLTGVKFAQDTRTGAEQAAKEHGPIDLTLNGPPSIDPVLAQKQVTDMLARRPDAMVVSPFPPEVWQRTLSTVSERVDSALTLNAKPVGTPEQVGSARLKTFVGINDTDLARTVMRETIAAAGLGKDTTGTVLLGQCVPGNTGVLFERIQGFRRVLQEQLPQVDVKVFDSKVDPQGNTNAWSDILKANPDPALAIGTCDQDGTSLYKVKKQTGADFPAGAVETPPETIRGLKDGTILASAAVNWYLEGYAAVKLAADKARGAELPEGWVDVGYTVITKDNVAEIERRDSSVEQTAAWYKPKVDEFFGDLQANVKPLADAWK